MNDTVEAFRTRLLGWYEVHHRKLPWRAVGADAHERLDAYHVLVSEAMLQQTQVATVIPYYRRFLARFPTVESLAGAEEQEVLRLWQGLGYYSRARNLQKAAREVVARFGGRVPGTVEELMTLPGVGRYTAGAVASIAHDRRAPILDGNVARVLCRVDAVEGDPRDKAVAAVLWARAEEVLPERRVGDFNSALMELGATVCTPRNPQCLVCPVRESCTARAMGVEERIPPVRKARETPLERRVTVCVRHEGRWLIEQRPATGRWAGMWQFVTRVAPAGVGAPSGNKSISKAEVRRITGIEIRSAARALGVVTHGLTHRRYEFYVYQCEAAGVVSHGANGGGVWVTLEELGRYPLPKPHVKVAGMLQGLA